MSENNFTYGFGAVNQDNNAVNNSGEDNRAYTSERTYNNPYGCGNTQGVYGKPYNYNNAQGAQYNPYGNNPQGAQYNPYGNSSQGAQYNPYGNSPQGAQYNPYGYNNQGAYNNQGGNNVPYGYNAPYGYSPYMNSVKRKKSFGERFNNYFRKEPYSGLAALAGFVSLGVLLYLGSSTVLGLILGGLAVFSDNLLDNDILLSVFGMLSSALCVGLPFIIVYIVMNRYENTAFRIPFNKPRKGSAWGLLIVAGLGLCYLGNIISSYLTAIFQMFGIGFSSTELTQEIAGAPDTPLSFILNLIYVAVFPAIFEEIAFRGVILQPLRKYGDWFAIMVSSVVFGLVHGNMTQMPFAIIVGVALGYTFIVTDSIIPSMIIHFFNNAFALVYSTVLSLLPEESALLFSAVSVYGLIFIGFVAFFAYTRTNRHYRKLRKGAYPGIGTRRKTGTFFLMPSMLAATVILVGQVLSDLMLGSLM